MYGTEVSPSLISSVTDAVANWVKAWQARPLEPIYPIVYLDCIHVKVRAGAVQVKAVYLVIGQFWRSNWSRLTPFFDYPPEIRKVIYTTKAIESVNMGLRKLSNNRGPFPSGEALTKLFYLALLNISQKRTMPIRDWKAALTRFTVQFGDRISCN